MLLQAVLLAAATSIATAISVTRRAAITDFTTSPVAFAWPPPRGFSSSNATDAPCGGIPSANRTSYPIAGGDIALVQQTDLDNVNILYTNLTDPTRFHAFSTYSDTILNISAGHFCQDAPDFGNLGFQVGDNATLLIIYQLEGVQEYYYHCADINLVDATGFASPVEYVCGNYTSTLDIASDDESLHLGEDSAGNASPSQEGTTSSTSSEFSGAAATASPTSSTSGDGLSAAAGGGIGAAVTLVLLALIIGGAYYAGWIGFGRKRSGVALDTSSLSSSSAGITTKQAHA
ncbi:hypothetical protein IAR55_005971 [Kwoniella newhampshirensis]|uniref:Copper acquisition factor BIM1-like domain-containing protein n=1 Tax=Kwoniella newhampshirensis TaxID=1651941 RepID=A0AAW0YV78_9TREE